MITEAIAILATGLALFFISLPLIFRKVPMNSIYGIRIPAAFESEQRWYDINAYGGRQLAAWSWAIIIVGAIGFFLPENGALIYLPVGTVIVLLAILIPLIRITRWSRQLPSTVLQTFPADQNEISATPNVSLKSHFLNRATLVPLLVLICLGAGYVIWIAHSASQLPERVATHFDAAGKPNGWMRREAYLHFIAVLGLALSFGIAGLGFILGILTARMKSPQPNPTTSKRRTPNVSRLGGDILWFACLMLCFIAGTHYSTIAANRSQPAHLSAASLGILVVGFSVGNVGWIILLCLHLLKKPAAPAANKINSKPQN